MNTNKFTKDYFYGYYKSKKHAAFTLAEVLITLGIIGVVAAMTIIFTARFTDAVGSTIPGTDVWVDINGSEGPNQIGRDVFWLVRAEDKGVFPKGFDKSDDYVNKNCKGKGDNTCAEKIRRAGWKIEKDYPW